MSRKRSDAEGEGSPAGGRKRACESRTRTKQEAAVPTESDAVRFKVMVPVRENPDPKDPSHYV